MDLPPIMERIGDINMCPVRLGCHELLDRVACAAEQIDRQLLDHRASIANSDWYNLAEDAATALRELYQRIGALHLDADVRPARGRGA